MPDDPIVMNLQTIVSREISPLEPAVVTVGSIHGGTQHSIIPEEVRLQLTLRSYSSEVRAQSLSAIKRLTNNLAFAYRLPPPEVLVLDENTPAAFNNPQLTERILNVFAEELGRDRIHELKPEMVGEDFGRFGAVDPPIPSLMFRLGTVDAESYRAYKADEIELPGLHSARFAPDARPTIISGIEAMTLATLELLED